MTRTPHDDRRDPGGEPSVAEIAAFTRRLRDLSAAGPGADPAERAAFLADKQALFDRIPAAEIGVPDPVGAAMDARFLVEGDRFRWAGGVHETDDTPVRHDGRLTVPTRSADGTATYVELADGDWVDLTDRHTPTGADTVDGPVQDSDAAEDGEVVEDYGPGVQPPVWAEPWPVDTVLPPEAWMTTRPGPAVAAGWEAGDTDGDDGGFRDEEFGDEGFGDGDSDGDSDDEDFGDGSGWSR